MCLISFVSQEADKHRCALRPFINVWGHFDFSSSNLHISLIWFSSSKCLTQSFSLKPVPCLAVTTTFLRLKMLTSSGVLISINSGKHLQINSKTQGSPTVPHPVELAQVQEHTGQCFCHKRASEEKVREIVIRMEIKKSDGSNVTKQLQFQSL